MVIDGHVQKRPDIKINPGVVNRDDFLPFLHLKSVATILRTSPLIAGIPIIVHDCKWCKGFRELLLAF